LLSQTQPLQSACREVQPSPARLEYLTLWTNILLRRTQPVYHP